MEYNVYRGQHGTKEIKIHSKLPSISFSNYDSAEIYANTPNNHKDVIVKSMVLSAYIKIENPIIKNEDDCFADFDKLVEKLGKDFMWEIAKEEGIANSIMATNNWDENFSDYHDVKELHSEMPEAIMKLYTDVYLLLDNITFIRKAKEKGFDGAIHMGNGATFDTLEYRIFSESQVMHLSIEKV